MTSDWDDAPKSKKQTEEEDEKYIEILKQPDIFKKYIKEFGKFIVGENKNKKLIFLSLNGRLVDNIKQSPHIIISNESSAGKDYVMGNILKIFPKEILIKRGRISPTALDYMVRYIKTWDGKILYIEDVTQSLLDSTSFKLLASKNKTEDIIHTITIKNKAVNIVIKGKPIIVTTTATGVPSKEIVNRFNIMSLDESKKQTKAIKEFQTKEAQEIKEKKYDVDLKEGLNILKSYPVVIPFADEIINETDDDLRVRRNLPRILDLIKCSAIFHQYQRGIENGHIVANKKDFKIIKECFDFKDNIKFTIKEKQAFEVCKKLNSEKIWFSVGDCYRKSKIVTLAMWYLYIDKFQREGLLNCEQQNIDGVKKPVYMYTLSERGMKYD